MVQDYFMSDTATAADLVLPASLPVESGGSFSNTSRFIQQFDKHFEAAAGLTGYEQLIKLLNMFGKEKCVTLEDVRNEIFSVLSAAGSEVVSLKITGADNYRRLFSHGCDYLVKRFDDEFKASFE